MNRELVA